MAVKSKPNELRIVRVYDAPVKAVWDAWTDPAQAAQWWGPRGFTITTHAKELRPGGFWHYTMHGPDGTDYPNKTVYFEVEKYAKLVYDHGANDSQPPLFRVTVLFSEKNKKTTMDMTMALATPEDAKNIKKFIKTANGNSTWDRLAEFVEKEKTGKEKFVINRSFEASIETVYDMWTKPEHFSKWLPPTGFTMTFVRDEIKVGNRTFFSMQNEDRSLVMYGSIRYLTLQRPDLLSYVQDFRDKDDKISRHPLAPLWPEEMLTTVELQMEPDDTTRVTITWEPHGVVKPEELAEFMKERTGMMSGWNGSFDKLEALLEARDSQ